MVVFLWPVSIIPVALVATVCWFLTTYLRKRGEDLLRARPKTFRFAVVVFGCFLGLIIGFVTPLLVGGMLRLSDVCIYVGAFGSNPFFWECSELRVAGIELGHQAHRMGWRLVSEAAACSVCSWACMWTALMVTSWRLMPLGWLSCKTCLIACSNKLNDGRPPPPGLLGGFGCACAYGGDGGVCCLSGSSEERRSVLPSVFLPVSIDITAAHRGLGREEIGRGGGGTSDSSPSFSPPPTFTALSFSKSFPPLALSFSWKGGIGDPEGDPETPHPPHVDGVDNKSFGFDDVDYDGNPANPDRCHWVACLCSCATCLLSFLTILLYRALVVSPGIWACCLSLLLTSLWWSIF